MPNMLHPSRYSELSLIVEPIPQFRTYLQENPNAPWIRGVPVAKIIARPERIVAVTDGAHSIWPINGVPLRSLKSNDLLIAHLPFTTRARFARKIDNIRKVFQIHDKYMGDDLGWHWRRWLALADQGRLDEEFDRNVFSIDTISTLRASGVIRIVDEVFGERLHERSR